MNNGSIHKIKSLKTAQDPKSTSKNVFLLSKKSYRFVSGSYPPKYPPYSPFQVPKFPLHNEIASLSLPVDPSSDKAFPDSSFWQDFNALTKNLLVIKFTKTSTHSNIKLAVFLDDPKVKENHWLWIEIPEDEKIKILEIPTRRFLEGKALS